MTENRIDELEIRVAHQDQALAELNDVVLAQWRKIEELERQLARINQDMQQVVLESVPVDKPPHY